MSATAASTIPRLPHTGKVTQARVIVSEWTKLWSLRSTRLIAAALLLTVGVAALACGVVAHNWPHTSLHDRQEFHPLEVNLAGVQIAQLAIGVLGVLVITGEYSTGMIRATMAAVPKRLPVLWAKAIVYGLVVLVLATPATLIAFVVGRGDPRPAEHRNCLFPSRCRARSFRGCALPHRHRSLRARHRRDRPQHRRRDRDARGRPIRTPAVDERASGQVARCCKPISPAQCGSGDHGAYPRPAAARSVDRPRPSLRLHRSCTRTGVAAPYPTRHMMRRGSRGSPPTP